MTRALTKNEINEMILSANGAFSCYFSGPETNFSNVKMQVVFWWLLPPESGLRYVFWWLLPPESGLRYHITVCDDARGRRQAADELRQWLRKRPV